MSRVKPAALLILVLLLAAPIVVRATQIPPDADAIARFVAGHRIVLLGEVHDNPAQHALRWQALSRLVAAGFRPALAFEQFDIEQQPDIDRARREKPADPDHLIAAAKGRGGWRWESYRPFVALALEHQLPIVAANLSRQRASAVATDGWRAVFDDAQREALKLDALPASFLAIHETAIDRGHCSMLPADALPAMARAQIARDILMAQVVQRHASRGVVLLAGNGHVRNDVGVPFWLDVDERREAVSVGALEKGDSDADAARRLRYDGWFVTATVDRADPCRDLNALPAVGKSVIAPPLDRR